MCNVECYVLLQLMSLSQNEFYAETAAFINATDLALTTIVVITSAIHIIGYSICHSCNINNYLTMWLFHVHNDNNISHITGVTISSATMATS